MTKEEQVTIEMAYVNGHIIERNDVITKKWITVVNPVFNWHLYKYRIKLIKS